MPEDAVGEIETAGSLFIEDAVMEHLYSPLFGKQRELQRMMLGVRKTRVVMLPRAVGASIRRRRTRMEC